MKQTCSKCGVQMYDPFFGTIKMHNEDTCCGVKYCSLETPMPIIDATTSCTDSTETVICYPPEQDLYNDTDTQKQIISVTKTT